MREQLRTTVESAAGPYGYTISLGGSTALASDRLGTPHLLAALTLMLGAVVGFATLELAARGVGPAVAEGPERRPTIWGNVHIPSAGGALIVVWAVLQIAGGELAWAATGFLATTVYFAVTSWQRVLAAAWNRRRGRAG